MASLLVPHPLGVRIIAYAWLSLAIIWIIGRILAKRIAHAQPAVTLILYYGILIVCLYELFRPLIFADTNLIGRTPEFTTAGLVVFTLGIAFALWARFVLANNWSGSIAIKVEHELIERGPYRWLRHPMYTGLILMVAGTAIVRGTPDAFLAVAIFVGIHLWKLGREEALLSAHFGPKYAAYRSRTRALIPFLY